MTGLSEEFWRARGQRASNALLTVVSAVPVVGGPIVTFLAGVISSREAARVEEVLAWVRERLDLLGLRVEELADRPDAETLAELLERSLVGAASSAHVAKREAYAALIVNGIADLDPNHEEQRFFVDIVDRSRPIHIRALQLMATGTSPDDERTIADAFPELAHDSPILELANLASQDLATWGLTQGPKSFQIHHLLREFNATGLTDLGRRCLAYITMPAGEATHST